MSFILLRHLNFDKIYIEYHSTRIWCYVSIGFGDDLVTDKHLAIISTSNDQCLQIV